MVRVLVFQGDTVGFDIIKGVVHQTTVATVVLLGAINQSLFGEFNQFFLGDEVKSFQSTNGRESPARSALTLVFNMGNTAFFSPVHRFGETFVT